MVLNMDKWTCLAVIALAMFFAMATCVSGQVPPKCTNTTCQNNGKCFMDNNVATCNCTHQYYGPRCTEEDTCATHTCSSGFTCVVQLVSCFVAPCPPLALCVNSSIVSEYTSCESSGNMCLNGGTCVGSLAEGFHCVCSPDFSGTFCQKSKEQSLPDPLNHCQYGWPLYKADNVTQVFCGLGPAAETCPSTHECNIAPNDAYAVCCPKKPDHEGNPCAYGQSLYKADNVTRIFCGKGLNPKHCPLTHRCNIAPNDAYAVCCPMRPGEVNPGLCPPIQGGNGICVEECSMDMDCGNMQKCCSNGCGHRCVLPEENPCNYGWPLYKTDNITKVFCGRGTNREDCPLTHVCNIAANDAYAMCCPKNPFEEGNPCAYGQSLYKADNVTRIFCGKGLNPKHCPLTHRCNIAPNDAYAVCCPMIPGEVNPGLCPPIQGGNGICVEECSMDMDCGNMQKCCSNGCGHRCVLPEENPCNYGWPLYKTDNITKVFCGRGTNREDCPLTHVCNIAANDAYAMCCPKNPFEVNPGLCPPKQDIGICTEYCSRDMDCGNIQKCCSNGCGHQCMTPDENPCDYGRPLYKADNVTQVFCGKGINTEYCPLTHRCNIAPNDAYAVCCPKRPVNPGLCPPKQDIGICAEYCSWDMDCGNIQKCCSNGCGHQCMTPEENPCAYGRPLYKADNVTRVFCGEGLNPENCPWTHRCNIAPDDAYAVCCPMRPVNPGLCPPIQGENGICVEECSRDMDCGNVHKCCSNGCGHRCVLPEENMNPCNYGLPLYKTDNITKVFCGRGPNRENCPLTHVCNIAANDGYAMCCPKKPFVDYCAARPCENGGVCLVTHDSTSFTCDCLAGYTGDNCRYQAPDEQNDVMITFKVNGRYSDISNIYSFEDAVEKMLINSGIPKDFIKNIRIYEGSIVVEITLSTPNNNKIKKSADDIAEQIKDMLTEGSIVFVLDGKSYHGNAQSLRIRSPAREREDKRYYIIIAAVCGGVGLIAICLLITLIWCKLRKRKRMCSSNLQQVQLYTVSDDPPSYSEKMKI